MAEIKFEVVLFAVLQYLSSDVECLKNYMWNIYISFWRINMFIVQAQLLPDSLGFGI